MAPAEGEENRVGWTESWVLARSRVLHFIGHQVLLVGHTIGEHILAFIQAFDSVGFEMDAAGNVLDVLHVCPVRRTGN